MNWIKLLKHDKFKDKAAQITNIFREIHSVVVSQLKIITVANELTIFLCRPPILQQGTDVPLLYFMGFTDNSLMPTCSTPTISQRLIRHPPSTIFAANNVLPAFSAGPAIALRLFSTWLWHRPQHGMWQPDNRHNLAIMEGLHGKRKF
ncbi:MAG: hypothetical protein ABSA86_10625 [Oryzomonas sp.]|jgi:hypothetical protein